MDYARGNALLGSKRLACAMVEENLAFLRPWMVYEVLAQSGLLGRRCPAPEGLGRPAQADHSDQRWRTDLLTLDFTGRWYGWWMCRTPTAVALCTAKSC